MGDCKKKFSCTAFNVSSPPLFAHFVKLSFKRSKTQSAQIDRSCKHKIKSPPPSLPRPSTVVYLLKPPVVSVVIPMYNAEEFIGECLDSVLLQTFQSFEVIVVDDCSTDNSCAIVESYLEKFNGRLRLYHTEKNSGGGGYVPRNLGLSLACGEYVLFLDDDDFLLLTALETLYNAATEYNTEVVYTAAYYKMEKPNDIYLYRDGAGKKLLKGGTEDKTDFRVDDCAGNLRSLLLEEAEGNFRNPWSKFARRDFLLRNEITFPNVTVGGDFIWCINVYCHAKRFLRLPTPLYFYRVNVASVSHTKRKPAEQISHWVTEFLNFMKSLNALESKNKILAENPAYCLAAFKSHFKWCLYSCREARTSLSEQEVYDILRNELAKSSFRLTVPFFLSVIEAERKLGESRLQTIKDLKREVSQLKNSPDYPAVSVIIPLYNAEKFIGECLDSLLNQTFQNFEVVVVDDCSTDNSVKVVEDYAEKFDGRLALMKMETNSGSGGLPRNKGLTLAKGEYIQFLDADDMLTKTALAELYGLAKKYDADVVDCAKHYTVNEDGSDIQIEVLQKGTLSNKPVLESKNFKERVDKVVSVLFTVSTCSKFVRRNLVIKNEIFFPHVCPSEDDIWTYGLVFHAEKFLHVPNAIYIRRLSTGSVMRRERSPQQTISFWLNPVLLGLKSLDNFMSRHEFFKTNPDCRLAVLKKFIETKLNLAMNTARELKEEDIYATIKDKFGERLGEYNVLIPALCTVLYNEKKISGNAKNAAQILSRKPQDDITARIDIKLRSTDGDFEITVSDDKAKVSKPGWLNKNGVGYQIQSYVGKLEFVAKATADGQINLSLRGVDVRYPNEKNKRIPYWIYYTKLRINDKIVFNEITPIWHDKPYICTFDTKAGEEIKISVEWLTHD